MSQKLLGVSLRASVRRVRFAGADSAHGGDAGRGTQQHRHVSLGSHAVHRHVVWMYPIDEVSADCARRVDRLSGTQQTYRPGRCIYQIRYSLHKMLQNDAR